ncbi:MAG TPA: malonate decarboxylase subunit delta [Steroidobacteraceae bacterium]
MEKLTFTYPAATSIDTRVHVGVVASGDLEVLLEPSSQSESKVTVNTSVAGFGSVWKTVLDRFFSRFNAAVAVEINDFGATPGLVMLRLEQAAEALLT